jgi:endonuclease YncB( thermonuclease family)
MARSFFGIAALTLVALACVVRADQRLRSYAFVNDDASLTLSGSRVHLAGIYIPHTRASCIDRANANCRTRAAAALLFRVRGFVECEILGAHSDGSLTGTCYVDRSRFDDGTDLGAYLIERGWAMAGRNAPFEYVALERLAENQGMGIWGNARVRTYRGFR